MGTSKRIISSAAFLFEVPELDLPLVAQELQIGGTGVSALLGRNVPDTFRMRGDVLKVVFEVNALGRSGMFFD